MRAYYKLLSSLLLDPVQRQLITDQMRLVTLQRTVVGVVLAMAMEIMIVITK